MKVEKINLIQRTPFHKWVAENLPSSLRVVRYAAGYGVNTYVVHECDQPTGLERVINYFRSTPKDPVAVLDYDGMILYHPQYLSDFEDLARKYEEQSGREITLQFWEGK